MNISVLMKNFLQMTVSKVLECVNKELDGKDKKAKVDVAVSEWLSTNASKLGLVQQFIVTRYVIPTVPVITQAIYDCLKKKVEGLTI